MLSKINVLGIVKDHTLTFKNEQKERISKSDVVIFYIVPFITGGILAYLNILLAENMINIIIASLSIFVGLLLNLLMLLMGLLEKYRDRITNLPAITNEQGVINALVSKQKDKLIKKQLLLNQTYYNISFAMLVALICIPIMIFALAKNNLLSIISNIVGYSLLLIFILTLLMVLKRVHVILKDDNKVYEL